MNADQRKQAILAAAAPLIAQTGLQGASVRQIAAAAGVSEALLYKHFASKRALYDEALAAARQSSQFTISRFAELTPSTESFVLLTYATVSFVMFGFPGRRHQGDGGARLIFHSLLDDGQYAKVAFADTAAAWMDYVMASYQASIDAGDLVELSIEPAHRFRFVQQLAMALRLSHLPPEPAIHYRGTKRELADNAVMFSLRGVGLTDQAIKRYFQPLQLRAALDKLFPETKSHSNEQPLGL